MQTKSIAENASYLLTFIDDHSRHIWVYLLKTKDQQSQAFENYRSLVETQYDRKIKVFRTDRGGEYQSAIFIDRLAELGIKHQRTIPDTPQQNGLAERYNRTLVESAKSMLHAAGLSYGFWGEAVRTAAHVRNRSPIKSTDWKTPHEMLTGRVPDISYLRIFGCKAYVHVLKKKRKDKMESQSSSLTFVGYEPNSKGYRFWNRSTRSIVVSTDATFDESSFPHKTNPSPPINIPVPNPSSDKIQLPLLLDLPLAPDAASDIDNTSTQPPTDPPIPTPSPKTPEQPRRPLESPPTPIANRTRPPIPSRGRGQQSRAPQLVIESVPTPRRSTRQRRGEIDRYLHLENAWDEVRDDGSIRRPRNRYLSIDLDTPSLYAVLLPGEPATYAEAVACDRSKDWHDAMCEEIDSLHKNSTWELVDLPTGRTAVKCKWVFRLKFNSAGEAIRYKARLVAKGFTQIFGLDFSETFSPVARLDSVRLLLALATLRDWEVHQIDVKSAFLNGELDEEIYMQQPEGFAVAGQENKVCRLQKALYGLKQASRQWHRKLDTAVRELGFSQSTGDPSVYVIHQQRGGSITVLIVYVDDITLMGDSIEQIVYFKKQLANRFEITDLGEISYYLGLRVIRNRSNRTITLDQEKYISDVLARFQMNSCTPANTPFASGTDFFASSSPAEDNDPSFIANYQSIVGSLMYAMIGTRPDISFAVSKLSQFSSNPTQQHLKAAKHVLRYLAATKNNRLHYGLSDETEIYGYSDSDWAGDKNDRHSTTGYAFFLAGGAICWASRRQPTVALSSTEAEYMAVCDASKHAIWLRTISTDFKIEIDNPTSIFVDNQGCIDLTSNPVHHKRTKHIDIRHHFIRECVEDHTVEILKIPTGENISDVLTKSLPLEKHSLFSGSLGLSS
jgi:Reverse transcriptase (RNA-dependent DNA polymerase)/Integrase core domain